MMMVLSALRPDASLPEFLAHRAKSASVRRLSFDMIIGLGVLAASLYWRPFAWLVAASAGAGLIAYGGWGLADRGRSSAWVASNLGRRVLLDTLCVFLGALGALAVAGLLLSVWAIALGTWIS